MSDTVTCVAVLSKSVDTARPDYLCLTEANDNFVSMPCIQAGRALSERALKRLETVERTPWVYEERGDRLRITPSLLCLESQFHTAYEWECAFAVCPSGIEPYDYFYQVNPGIQKPQ